MPLPRDRTIAGGNFGAGPKPPKRGSKPACNPSTAAPRSSGPAVVPVGEVTMERARAPEISPAASSTSERRFRHASAVASITRVNDGMPWRSAGGK